MGLQDELNELKSSVMQSIPVETAGIMAGSMKKIEASGISARVRKKGDRAPSFTLPNVYGQMISSQILLQQGPLVINFYRGAW